MTTTCVQREFVRVCAYLGGHDGALAFAAHHNAVLGKLKMTHVHLVRVLHRRLNGGHVHEIGKIGARKTRGPARQHRQLHVCASYVSEGPFNGQCLPHTTHSLTHSSLTHSLTHSHIAADGTHVPPPTGTFLVYRSKICRRPSTSGGGTCTCRSNPAHTHTHPSTVTAMSTRSMQHRHGRDWRTPRAHEGLVQHLGEVGGGNHDHTVRTLEPNPPSSHADGVRNNQAAERGVIIGRAPSPRDRHRIFCTRPSE